MREAQQPEVAQEVTRSRSWEVMCLEVTLLGGHAECRVWNAAGGSRKGRWATARVKHSGLETLQGPVLLVTVLVGLTAGLGQGLASWRWIHAQPWRHDSALM